MGRVGPRRRDECSWGDRVHHRDGRAAARGADHRGLHDRHPGSYTDVADGAADASLRGTARPGRESGGDSEGESIRHRMILPWPTRSERLRNVRDHLSEFVDQWSTSTAARTGRSAGRIEAVNGNGRRTRWRWRWLALLVGAVPALAFPGPSVWVLGLIGLVPLLLVIRSAPTAREGTLRAWLGGVGFFLAVDHWLLPNVGPALPVFAALLAVTWLPAGLAAWWALRPAMVPARLAMALVVVPAAWVVGEYARSWQYLGGPWAVLGASQWNDRPVLSVAALGGVWLVSGVLVAVNVAVAAVFVPGTRWPARVLAAGGGLAVVAVAVGAGALLGPPRGTATVFVAGVQPGAIADAAARFAGSEQASLALGAGSAAPRPDLVVWGESSVGVDPADQPGYL